MGSTTPSSVIVDAGPLVAFLDPADPHHRLVADLIGDLPMPMLSVESVMSELAFLLRRNRRHMSRANWVVSSGMVEIVPMFPDHADEIAALMDRYDDVPMSIADACLVRLSELLPEASLLTLDSDFEIYRRFERQPLPLVPFARGVQEPATAYLVGTPRPQPTNPSSTDTT